MMSPKLLMEIIMAKRDKKTDVSHLDSADKTILIHLLQEQNNLLKEKYHRLEAKVKMLESRLAKNSNNSSKPPSSDINKPKKKPKKTTSSKPETGKKPGGQPGHKGVTLQMSTRPDKVIKLKVDACAHCGNHLKHIRPDLAKRQQFEIPEPKMWVTEYQAEIKDCKRCGYTTTACFPEGITHVTQYGPRAKSLMVYMNQYQLIPFDRGSQFFKTIYSHNVSPGTIVNAVGTLSCRYEEVEMGIKKLLIKSSLVNCDETSMKICGSKQWIHTVGNTQLTHYGMHEKRGRQATEAIGILPEFDGTMVHDHWKSYFTYKKNRHGLCNAHHLRELRFIYEQQGLKWGKQMSDLLIEINDKKNSLLRDKKKFSRTQLKNYCHAYDDILSKAAREQARRGTIDSSNLLKRLKNYKEAVLLFMNDMDVPFTNNLSERDIRMMKVKQKISGCFRNKVGGDNFCRIRSVMSTAMKNKKNIFNILQESFQKIILVNSLLADS